MKVLDLTRLRSRAAVCAALVSSVALAQNNFSFLRESPWARLTDQDFDLMRSAAAVVLKSTAIGTSKTWRNPASGNSGAVKLVNSFMSTDARECKRLELDNVVKSLSIAYTMNVCLFADRGWLIDTEARPKP